MKFGGSTRELGGYQPHRPLPRNLRLWFAQRPGCRLVRCQNENFQKIKVFFRFLIVLSLFFRVKTLFSARFLSRFKRAGPGVEGRGYHDLDKMAFKRRRFYRRGERRRSVR